MENNNLFIDNNIDKIFNYICSLYLLDSKEQISFLLEELKKQNIDKKTILTKICNKIDKQNFITNFSYYCNYLDFFHTPKEMDFFINLTNQYVSDELLTKHNNISKSFIKYSISLKGKRKTNEEFFCLKINNTDLLYKYIENEFYVDFGKNIIDYFNKSISYQFKKFKNEIIEDIKINNDLSLTIISKHSNKKLLKEKLFQEKLLVYIDNIFGINFNVYETNSNFDKKQLAQNFNIFCNTFQEKLILKNIDNSVVIKENKEINKL